jgi:glycosyltransferase involved in cell wall biosynthesis
LPEALSATLLRPCRRIALPGNGRLKRVVDLVDAIRPDIVICDMLRLGLVAESLRRHAPSLPILLDLDDLLSLRYCRALERGSSSILGHYGRSLPWGVRQFGSFLPRTMLALEARLMARAERAITRTYDGVATVSESEARLLDGALGQSELCVRGVPPVLDVPAPVGPSRKQSAASQRSPLRFVFVGNAQYGPNAEALQTLDRIAGRLLASLAASDAPVFEAAGQPNHGLRLDHVIARGWVNDLPAFLAGRCVLVAPLASGSGIKLKIGDAVAAGVPIVTTPLGVEGLPLRHGEHCLVAEDEADMEKVIAAIATGAISEAQLSAMARNAQIALAKTCSRQAVFDTFGELVHAAIARRAALAGGFSDSPTMEPAHAG